MKVKGCYFAATYVYINAITCKHFSGQALHAFHPGTSPHNDPSYQEEPNSVLAQAIFSIGGFNVE
jgi:hypothetical protein